MTSQVRSSGRKRKSPSKAKLMHVSVLLDASGSMFQLTQATIEGFNGYIETLKGSEKVDNVRVTLTDFDTQLIQQHFSERPLKELEPLTNEYHTRGGTPLYDAIGRVIADMERETMYETDPVVLIEITTDGQENSSQAYNQQQIATLIEKKQSEGWTFTYSGANQDVGFTQNR